MAEKIFPVASFNKPDLLERPKIMGGGPPFNDSPPCVVCPTEIRALYDLAVNVVIRCRQVGNVTEQEIDQLGKACAILKPHIDHHFLDTAHSVPAAVLEDALRKANLDDPKN